MLSNIRTCIQWLTYIDDMNSQTALTALRIVNYPQLYTATRILLRKLEAIPIISANVCSSHSPMYLYLSLQFRNAVFFY